MARRFLSKSFLNVFLPAAAGFLSLILAGAAMVQYHRALEEEAGIRWIETEMEEIRSLKAGEPVTERLTKVSSLLKSYGYPAAGIEYAILYRRWEQANRLLEGIRNSGGNAALSRNVQEMRDQLQQLLADIREDCSATLREQDSHPSPVIWKCFNLRGCLSVMQAYTVLEFEGDARKGEGLLNEALGDFKSAVSHVDSVGTSSFERSLPRWNLELITSRGEYRKVGLGEARRESMQEMIDQLEAVLPQMGGYDPGSPVETRVKK